MFALALAILPFGDLQPSEAIQASLARFKRGKAGELPVEWLAFDDETEIVCTAHEADFTFSRSSPGGLSIRGAADCAWLLDRKAILAEMDRRGVSTWSVRFADTMGLDAFADSFGGRSKRDPKTGRFGQWLNGLGRWDWWDLGGRFDGWLIGDRQNGNDRSAGQISSGYSAGRSVLANIENALGQALGQEPTPSVDVTTDRNIELAATVIETLRLDGLAEAANTVVLPPGVVDDRLRWIDSWPVAGPADTFTWLGLESDAAWPDVVEATLERFADHWVAGVAYHR